ncbi:hypothetical protein [Rhizobium sp. IBUN]|uniref:hypothetical protein n=1 Tax=Rhizobium sp. IBUN TaxID=1042326 RepID=UPI00046F12F2|nr:hypothetical protein [Rhizobium sp. IBUN]
MSLGVKIVVPGQWSQFSIFDVDGSADCEDGAGKKIKNRDVTNVTFDVTIDGQAPDDPGEVEVSGLAPGSNAKTVKSYPVTKRGGVITFPTDGVVYPILTTLEMIHATPDFDTFVIEVGNRFRALAPQGKPSRSAKKGDHQE